MRRFLLCALLLALPASARAEPIGFAYEYFAVAGNINASGYGAIDVSSSASDDGQNLTVSFGGNRLDVAFASGKAVGTTDQGDFGPATRVPIGTVIFTPAALPGKGSFYFDAYFDGVMKVTDASGESTELSLGLSVWGDTSPYVGASAAIWRNTFNPPVLGGHAYEVYAGGDAILPGDNGELTGVLYADVSAGGPDAGYVPPYDDSSDGDPLGDPIPQSLPEPSSLLLGAAGLSLVALARLRRQKIGSNDRCSLRGYCAK